ncbi:MAG: hypothetical protein HRT61_11495, partial [Ekhidna sp.]|nr:hypothetical protein [Ekhidna sp.]
MKKHYLKILSFLLLAMPLLGTSQELEEKLIHSNGESFSRQQLVKEPKKSPNLGSTMSRVKRDTTLPFLDSDGSGVDLDPSDYVLTESGYKRMTQTEKKWAKEQKQQGIPSIEDFRAQLKSRENSMNATPNFELTPENFFSFGSPVGNLDISSDGSRLVIGLDLDDTNGDNAGLVEVYENSSGTWTQIGQDILGESGSDQAGYSLSISGDGSTVAVASRINTLSDTAGYVRLYRLVDGSWQQIGQSIQGSSNGDVTFFRENVSLNGDGSVLAFASDSLRIYNFTNDVWEQDETVLASGPYNLSLDATGSKLVAGSWLSSSATMFVKDAGQWNVTSTVSGGGFFGFSVDLSKNGQFAAIGSVFEGVLMYEINENNEFELRNSFPAPNESSYFGWDVSVTNAGKQVAVADPIENTTEIYSDIGGFW